MWVVLSALMAKIEVQNDWIASLICKCHPIPRLRKLITMPALHAATLGWSGNDLTPLLHQHALAKRFLTSSESSEMALSASTIRHDAAAARDVQQFQSSDPFRTSIALT